MNNPSFYAYDRRDPLEQLNYEEKMRWWTKFCLWMVTVVLFLTLLHLTITPHLTVEVKAAQASEIEDDRYICSHLNSNNTKGQAIEIYQYCLKYGK